MQKYCFLNDKICPTAEATVSIYDLSLLRGYGLFDYFRTYNGKLFSYEEHIDRFFASAEEMQLTVPQSKKEIRSIIADLFRKNGLSDGAVRLVLTGGDSMDCFSPAEKANFIIMVDELPVYDPKVWTEGISLMTHEYQRVFPEIKSNNYLTAVALQPERRKKGAFDILYTYQGNVLECTRSNFFGIKDGKIITAGKDVYIGRTRNIALDLAKQLFPVEEKFITTEELFDLDEAFVTGTTKKIMPVTTVDEKTIGDGQVGPITKKLMAVFDDLIASF